MKYKFFPDTESLLNYVDEVLPLQFFNLNYINFYSRKKMYCACLDGKKLVGLVTIAKQSAAYEDAASISQVSVNESYQGQGIASKLVNMSVDIFIEKTDKKRLRLTDFTKDGYKKLKHKYIDVCKKKNVELIYRDGIHHF